MASATPSPFNPVISMRAAIMDSYLLSGQYRLLGGQQVARSAFRARLTAIVSIALLAS